MHRLTTATLLILVFFGAALRGQDAQKDLDKLQGASFTGTGPAWDRGAVLDKWVLPGSEKQYSHPSATAILDDNTIVSATVWGSFEGESTDIAVFRKPPDGNWSNVKIVARHDGPYGLWDPVIFQVKSGSKPLLLYFRRGGGPHSWRGEVMQSTDGGKTWGPRHILPTDRYMKWNAYPGHLIGPEQNQPIEFPDGSLLAVAGRQKNGLQDADSHVEKIPAKSYLGNGDPWKVYSVGTAGPRGVINGAFLILPSKFVKSDWSMTTNDRQNLGLMVREGVQGRSRYTHSSDGGKSWAPIVTQDADINAGNAAVSLDPDDPDSPLNGWHVVSGAYHSSASKRDGINIYIANDNGNANPKFKWQFALRVDSGPDIGETADPYLIQGPDRMLHLQFSGRAAGTGVRHYVIDPYKLVNVPPPGGRRR